MLIAAALAPVCVANSTTEVFALEGENPDPALTRYRAVMDAHEAMENGPDDRWDLVERWCDDERDALTALAEDFPPGLEAFLHRVVAMVARVEEVGHNAFQAEEIEVFYAIGERAEAMLEGKA
ncbi:hypothetical protein [Roseomonas sp. KE0001]|uniref:hypothetical protein n=1 Tax=Roseomonas sp. KE0001 TaxID=2479201 RepID=UPI0018E054B7|nr:hypothetical protein [Roseomonas sp. KE0001]